MRDHDRTRLLEILRREALLRGDFTLASGQRSNVYLDCRRATLHPEGATLSGRELLRWVAEAGLAPDCVGGPTLGADPIVGAMVTLSWLAGQPLPGFLVRKQAKDHGTGQRLEGQHRPGWRAVIVEDTVTTGGSLLDAAAAAEEAGLVVVALACLVDRRADRGATLGGRPFTALFTMEEVVGGA